jgi:ligand-binding sensor domain-containing protein/tRNA A-37 threonylcarbamoyl transferase component Bud32
MLIKHLKVIILLNLFVSSAFAQKLPFTHYTPDNEIAPLPGAAIYRTYQDRLGYMWICVYSAGLVRYNGHRMDLYTTADGLSGLSVMNVLEDSLGRLWVLTDIGMMVSDRPLSRYPEGSRVRFTKNIGRLVLGEISVSQVGVNSLTVDRKGCVWLGTTGLGILRYTLHGLDSVQVDTFKTATEQDKKNRIVYALYPRSDGSLWASVENDLLLHEEGSSAFKKVIAPAEYSNTHVFYESPDSVLWAGCADGLIWKLRKGESRIETFNRQLNNAVYSIIQTSDGRVWIASDGDGVLRLENGHSDRGTIFTNKNGLLSKSVRYINADRENNLWFAQVGGVSKLRANYSAFVNLTPDSYRGSDEFDPNISGICPPDSFIRNNILWTGTGNGVMAITPNRNLDILDAARGLSNNTVYDVITDEKGRVWIGTFTGLNCITFDASIPRPLGNYPLKDILILNKKAKLSFYDAGIIGVCGSRKIPIDQSPEKKTESLWFNSYRQLICYANEAWFVFAEASGLPPSIVYAIAFDNRNYLYVGTGDQGLYRSKNPISISYLNQITGKSPDHYGREVSELVFEPVWNRSTGAPFNDPQELIWIDGSLWVGSASKGLAVLDGDSLRMTAYFTADSGLKNSNVISMAISPVTHTLWAGTNDGLYEIDPKKMKIMREVNKQMGLLSSETNWLEALAIDDMGTIYFGTPKGLSIYDPNLDQINSIVPVMKFSETRFNENFSGDNELFLEYAALSFANEKLVRYKTRLSGYDVDWSPPTSDFKIRYTNLPAFLFSKSYTFEVMACNNDGIWSKEALKYSFNVTPAWWLRWWAFIIYTGGFSILFIGVRWFTIHWREILMPRTKYIAHYKLQELLGEGGMGKVFKAYDTMLKKTLAVKVLNQDIEQSIDGIRRFIKEAEIGRKLDHPYLVKIFEAGSVDKIRYLTMEFVEGKTLKQYIREKNRLEIPEAILITRRILEGLRAIHENDTIHRDIKSDNVMIQKDGNLKIMDFGLARTKGLTTIVNREQLVGTLAYMSPEQTIGKTVDFRSDIYSVGVIMYEMVYGELPFRGNNEMELIMAIHNQIPPELTHKKSLTLEALNQIVLKCLEKDPGKRFSSCGDVLQELNAIEFR